MGIIIGVLSALVVAVFLFLIGPFLLYWITKKFEFDNNTKFNHGVFWAVLIGGGLLISGVTGMLTEQPSQSEAFQFDIWESLLSNIVINLLVFAILLKLIFRQDFLKTIKSSIVYFVLSAVLGVVIGFGAVTVFSGVFLSS